MPTYLLLRIDGGGGADVDVVARRPALTITPLADTESLNVVGRAVKAEDLGRHARESLFRVYDEVKPSQSGWADPDNDEEDEPLEPTPLAPPTTVYERPE